jgi:hypothetical protein
MRRRRTEAHEQARTRIIIPNRMRRRHGGPNRLIALSKKAKAPVQNCRAGNESR